MSYEMLKERFGTRVFADKERTVPAALDNAYADMSRRQNGHGPELKNVCIDMLVEVFSDPAQIAGQDYDTWHRKLSEELIQRWNSVEKGFGTIGKAQKVINMAWKYLSCISTDYDEVLPFCHMTLDSYTLDWYEEVVKPWAKAQDRQVGRKVSAWSKIESYDEYLLIQHNIRDYLASGAHYSIFIDTQQTQKILLSSLPAEAEFIIWEGQIIDRKYNDLIKLLENYAGKNKKLESGATYDNWLLGPLFLDYLRGYLNNF